MWHVTPLILVIWSEQVGGTKENAVARCEQLVPVYRINGITFTEGDHYIYRYECSSAPLRLSLRDLGHCLEWSTVSVVREHLHEGGLTTF